MPESPEEKGTASKKHKKNPLVTPEVMFHIKSLYQNKYQRILFYWNPGKIVRMRERLVPGPYLSPSAPMRVKGPKAKLAHAVSLTNTNFRLTFLLTRLQEALYEDLAV